MSEESKSGLPKCGADYIDLVAKKVRYRRRVRAEVRQELTDHFTDALHGIADEQQRVERAMSLIKEFGDPRTLATLIRRGKKRCRPLWLRAFIRTCQAFGIIILYVSICTTRLFVGTPGHAVDYVAKLNEAMRGGYAESQNAQLVLDEANSVMVPIPDWVSENRRFWRLPLDVNDMELANLKAWVDSNEKAIELLRKASRMPARWTLLQPAVPERTVTDGDTAELMRIWGFKDSGIKPSIYELSQVKMQAYVLRWHCAYAAHTGNCAEALDDAMTILRIAMLFEGNGNSSRMNEAVGIALEAMGYSVLADVLANCHYDAAALAAAQAELQRAQQNHPMPMEILCQKMIADARIQNSYTEGGRMLLRGAALACPDWRSFVKGSFLGYPDKSATQKMVDEYFAGIEETRTKTPWQRRGEEQVISESTEFRADVLYRQMTYISWLDRATREATLAILAIKRFELEKGSLPESLDQLAASGYLAELPMDPWSDKPLVYRLTSEGFTLYSVHEDFTDDGGRPRPKDYYEREKGGWDWVFWPLRHNQ